MYHTCIFCSKKLGSNEVVEHFPVGSRLAFDAARGRLWAICPRCTRWNLAPIEERWEAVEEAEAQFRGARQRVQSENIGLAKLPDGTRLVRIGSALPGELAAWRYGSQLVKRRTNMYLGIGASIAVGGAIAAGLPLIAGVGIPVTAFNAVVQSSSLYIQYRANQRVVLKLDAHESPTGQPFILRRRHIANAQLGQVDGELALSIIEPPASDKFLQRFEPQRTDTVEERMWLSGSNAQLVAARAMVDHNSRGANERDVNEALRVLTDAGSAEAYLERIARMGPTIVPPSMWRKRSQVNITPSKVLGTFRGVRLDVPKMGKPDIFTYPLQRAEALALEMALHDESERRALEGELSILEDAWREAEEIAQIADALPDEPPVTDPA